MGVFLYHSQKIDQVVSQPVPDQPVCSSPIVGAQERRMSQRIRKHFVPQRVLIAQVFVVCPNKYVHRSVRAEAGGGYLEVGERDAIRRNPPERAAVGIPVEQRAGIRISRSSKCDTVSAVWNRSSGISEQKIQTSIELEGISQICSRHG